MIQRELLDAAFVPGGEKLELFRHDRDFMIVLGHNELMSTRMNGSEIALAEQTCDRLAGRKWLRPADLAQRDVIAREAGSQTRTLFEDTLKRQTATLGAGHISTLTTRMNLATALMKSGDATRAEREYAGALEEAERSLPAGHERITQLRTSLEELRAKR